MKYSYNITEVIKDFRHAKEDLGCSNEIAALLCLAAELHGIAETIGLFNLNGMSVDVYSRDDKTKQV